MSSNIGDKLFRLDLNDKDIYMHVNKLELGFCTEKLLKGTVKDQKFSEKQVAEFKVKQVAEF